MPSTDASQLVLGPTSPGVDLELVRALLELGVLQAMVTPIVEPGGGDIRDASVVPRASDSGVVDGGLGSCVGGLSYFPGGGSVRDQSLSCQVSPPVSVSEPTPSLISPSLRSEDVARSPSGLAPMDQYLPRRASLGESTDSPFLSRPRLLVR